MDKAMGPGTSTVIALPPVNIGTISSGIKVNMIPERCIFELDIRLPVGLQADEVTSRLNSLMLRYSDAIIELKKQEAASNPSSFRISTIRLSGTSKRTQKPWENFMLDLFLLPVLPIANIIGMLVSPRIFMVVDHTAVSVSFR